MMNATKIYFIVLFLVVNTAFSQEKEQGTLPINSNMREIIVICKSHFDLGYTHLVKDLIPYYRTTMIDKALNIMDQTNALPEEQQFAWTAPCWGSG